MGLHVTRRTDRAYLSLSSEKTLDRSRRISAFDTRRAVAPASPGHNRIGVGQPRSKTPQGNIFPPGTGLKSRRLFSRHNLALRLHMRRFRWMNSPASRISTSPAVGLTAPNACIETPNPKLCQPRFVQPILCYVRCALVLGIETLLYCGNRSMSR